MASILRTRIDELAGRSHGILTTPELHTAGYTDAEIHTMVRKGYLIRIRRAVYAVGHLALGDDARRMARVRCAGEGAALHSISAARCWSITRRHDPTVAVVVPRYRRPVPGAQLTVDQRLPKNAITTVRGIPVLTPTWSIATSAIRLGAGELTRVMREASYRRILDLPALVQIADSHEGRAGIPVLRRAIELRAMGSSGYASALEQQVNRYIRRRDVPAPVPNALVEVAADTLEVDLVWRTLNICAEIDGPIHDDPDVQRDDLDRMQALQESAWLVFRIHWRDWEDNHEAAVAPVLQAVRERAADETWRTATLR